jgi:dihydrofolate synthase/folylpolyglutamate synthase
MVFDEAVRYLLSLGHETLTIKLGLRNTELLLASLGNPGRDYPAVQIAGTNGKGSTAVMLDAICRAAGVKTGLFTSPHLNSITERIKISGREVSRSQFASSVTRVRRAAEGLLFQKEIEELPTFFEHVTAIALATFQAARIELAVLETGLGGRLDATTAVGAGLIALTPISLDHEEFLGPTIESVAAEKAAIIHRGAIAVIAPQPAEALAVILRQCRLCDVEPILIDESQTEIKDSSRDGRLQIELTTKHDHYGSLWLGLRGRHQITNARLAVQLAECLRDQGFSISRAAIVEGLEDAQHAGRLELHDGRPAILLDGAHNPAGAQGLRSYLDEFAQQPLTLIFGGMRDKKLVEMAAILFPKAERVILTQIDNPRSATIQLLQSVAAAILESERSSATLSVSEALNVAKKVTPVSGLICVAGSLYLVGEVKTLLQKELSAANYEL